jgi:hypothetical protein
MRKHYIYKITRDDGHYYVGMHSTDNPNDGYFGSGKIIVASIEKHGKEKHKKEILEYLPSREALKAREAEMITEDMRNDPMCMNIAPGGGGGFIDEEHQLKCAAAGGRVGGRTSGPKNQLKMQAAKYARPEWFAAHLAGQARMMTEAAMAPEANAKRIATLADIKHQQGASNSQFGTVWVTNGKPIKIKKEHLDDYIARGYKKGRK